MMCVFVSIIIIITLLAASNSQSRIDVNFIDLIKYGNIEVNNLFCDDCLAFKFGLKIGNSFLAQFNGQMQVMKQIIYLYLSVYFVRPKNKIKHVKYENFMSDKRHRICIVTQLDMAKHSPQTNYLPLYFL